MSRYVITMEMCSFPIRHTQTSPGPCAHPPTHEDTHQQIRSVTKVSPTQILVQNVHMCCPPPHEIITAGAEV